MGRPRTTVGDWGKINSKRLGPKHYRAWTRYRAADGKLKTIQRFAESESAAEKAVLKAAKELADRVAGSGGLTPESTARELIVAYLKEVEANRSATTHDQYSKMATRHIYPAIGDLQVRECSTGRLDTFVASLTPGNAKLVRAVLSGAFSLAARHDAVRTSPVDKVARPSSKTDDEGPRALTMDELAELRARVYRWMTDPNQIGRKRNPDIGEVVDVLAGTGIRIGELCALRWTDIDLKAQPPTLTVTGTVVRSKDKGLWRKPFPKSKAGYRRLRLPAFTVAVLLRRQVESASELVFPSSTGTLREVSNLERQWRDARGETFEWVTPHSFRRTIATLLTQDDDGNDRAAMAQLGHSRIAVTEGHYIDRPEEAPDNTKILARMAPKLDTTLDTKTA